MSEDFEEEDIPIFDPSQLYGNDNDSDEDNDTNSHELENKIENNTNINNENLINESIEMKESNEENKEQVEGETNGEIDGESKEENSSSLNLKQRLSNIKLKINQGRKANRLEVEEEFKKLQARRKHEIKLKTKQNNGENDDELKDLDIEEKLLQQQEKELKNKTKNNKKEDREYEENFILKDSNHITWYDKKNKSSNPLNISVLDAEWIQNKNQTKLENINSASGQALLSTKSYRSYEKDINKLVSSTSNSSSSSTSVSTISPNFDPTYRASAAGLARLSEDIERKIEKRIASRSTSNNDDANGINDKNERFIKKLKRSYDKYTVEIKQNLERGTALN